MGTLWLFEIKIRPVKTLQFSLLFSTAYFGLKGHHQVEQRIKRIYVCIYIHIYTVYMDSRSPDLTIIIAKWVYIT